MNPRRIQGESHRDRWMISYLDVVTILLIFFVAAAAKTLPSRIKPPEPPPPAAPPALVLIDARQPPQDKIQQALEKAGLEARRETRGLVVSLPQAILFSSGDDRIGPDAFPIVEQLADVLRCIPNQVILIGHADSVPIHTRRFKNNWELSTARGMRLLELLSGRYEIDEARMSVSGDGSNRPATTNDTPDGRASNRRVEVVILDEPVAR
jgi:chemotaxis protein MotB